MLFFPLQVCATSAVIRKQMIHHHANRFSDYWPLCFTCAKADCSAMKIARIITMLGNKRHHKTGRIGNIPSMARRHLIRRKSKCAFKQISCTIASRHRKHYRRPCGFCYFDHALSIGSTTISSPPPATGRPYDACKRTLFGGRFRTKCLEPHQKRLLFHYQGQSRFYSPALIWSSWDAA